MQSTTLTNLLLTGILLMQAFALIFRRSSNPKSKTTAGNPPKFPLL
jgi:hypothetical protein